MLSQYMVGLSRLVIVACAGSVSLSCAEAQAAGGSLAQVQRMDFAVTSDPGVQIAVREVSIWGEQLPLKLKPIVLVHGARVPGIASFDLRVSGGSLAGYLAEQGFDVFVMDVRGYGKSTRPREMDDPAEMHAPLVRTEEAARDIDAVVNRICARNHDGGVALLGWATGGQWAAYYASVQPERVSALITLNSLYGGSSLHASLGHGSDSEDPAHAGEFNRKSCGAYRLNDEASLFRAWDRSIPDVDKSLWRDPAVARAYAAEAVASDPTSGSRTPPSFRSPCGRWKTVSIWRLVESCGTPERLQREL